MDFAFSNAVFEHIRRSEVAPTLAELCWVLKPGGSSLHRIDLKDHLGAALHHLRFPSRVWESRWFAGSGFYTNRLGFGELLSLFAGSGFLPQVVEIWRWPVLPTPRERMQPCFRERSEEDLLVSGFDVWLRPAILSGQERVEGGGERIE